MAGTRKLIFIDQNHGTINTMNTIKLNVIIITISGIIVSSAFAEERRNQYSNSIMLEAPDVYEDPGHKTERDQENEYCRELKNKIKELKYRPVRRSAARERYQAECQGRYR